ncbi:MAG TPA: nicotinamide riboside transporter PnuC [Flavitalea sp.]|nr:nicotinamide riboside transporter PnuC [Flavitalea sp.]
MQELWSQFFAEIAATSLPVWTAVILGVVQVLLARSNNILLYPAGIISSGIFVWIFIEAMLYAESALNAYYVIMSIYGWWYWARKKTKPLVPITESNQKDKLTATTIVVAGTLTIWWVLSTCTNSNVPFWDALVSATAWAGMWLLARRKIENWILLNISNAFAVPLLFYKHLPLSALLTVFLFIIAVLGYFKWKRIIQQEDDGNDLEMA